MRKLCGFTNCPGEITKKDPGAKIGFVIDGTQKSLLACSPCAYKIMTAPRGTWNITKDHQLKAIPAKPLIL